MNSVLKSLSTLALAIIVAGCASTGQNFDESKISQIKKGVTTEAELVQMFGAPTSRAMNSEGNTTLNWMYAEVREKGTSFIPYAGTWVGGTQSKEKSLTVTLGADGKVASFASSVGGLETRQTTQDVPKK